MSITHEVARWASDHFELLAVALFTSGLSGWQMRLRRLRFERARKALKKAVDTQTAEPISLHPEVNPDLCAGCGSCTRACPEGEVLQLIDHKAVLVSPTKCVGHGECEIACPTGAITLVFGTKSRGMDIPRITSEFETNVPGLYIAGELGGMGLIRNAVKQGALAARHALERVKAGDGASARADVDLLVVGAGPAGLAASLAAIDAKASYACIEQNSFGGTVYNFPRQKVVMSVPVDLPGAGQMKFKGNKVSKEELLEFWDRLRRERGIEIRERVKFESLEAVGEGGERMFRVRTGAGEITARKVILAMGVRGAPRKLGLPNEDLPKVTYNLIDPEQYQDKDIAVVGGGNAGVEAAQYLANPKYRNCVTLLVRGSTFDRCNEENKRIIEEMENAGQVSIWYCASVKEIQLEKLRVARGEETVELPNDFLFVFAGAEMPHRFLMSLGIQIDKKFGDPLGKGT